MLSGGEQKLAALIRLSPLESYVDAVTSGDEVGDCEAAVAGRHRHSRGPERPPRPGGQRGGFGGKRQRAGLHGEVLERAGPASDPRPGSRASASVANPSAQPGASHELERHGTLRGRTAHLERRSPARQVTRQLGHRPIRARHQRSCRELTTDIRPHHGGKRISPAGPDISSRTSTPASPAAASSITRPATEWPGSSERRTSGPRASSVASTPRACLEAAPPATARSA